MRGSNENKKEKKKKPATHEDRSSYHIHNDRRGKDRGREDGRRTPQPLSSIFCFGFKVEKRQTAIKRERGRKGERDRRESIVEDRATNMPFIVVDFGSANSAQFDTSKDAVDAVRRDLGTALPLIVTEETTPELPRLSLRQLLAHQASATSTNTLLAVIEAAHTASDQVVMARVPTTGELSLVPSVSLEDLDINSIVIDPMEEDIKNQMMRLRMMFTDNTEVEQNVTASIDLLHTWATHYYSPSVDALVQLVEEEQQYMTRAREEASTETKSRFDQLTTELADLMSSMESLRGARDEVVALVEEQAQQAHADAAADQKHLEHIVAAAEAEEADRETLEELNAPSRVEAVQQCLHCIHERMLTLHTTTQEPMQRLSQWARAAADAVHAHRADTDPSTQPEKTAEEEEEEEEEGKEEEEEGSMAADGTGDNVGRVGEKQESETDEDKNQGDKNQGDKEREKDENQDEKLSKDEDEDEEGEGTAAGGTTVNEDGDVDGRPLSVVDHGHRRSPAAKKPYAFMASPVEAREAHSAAHDGEDGVPQVGEAAEAAATAATAAKTTLGAPTLTASSTAVAVTAGQQTERTATSDVAVQHQAEQEQEQQQQQQRQQSEQAVQGATDALMNMSMSCMTSSTSSSELRRKVEKYRARIQDMQKEKVRLWTTVQQTRKERDDVKAQLRVTEDKLKAERGKRSKRSTAPPPTDPKVLKEQEDLLTSLQEDLKAARAEMKDVRGHRDAIATERDSLVEEKTELALAAKQQAVRVSELQAHVASLEEQLSLCREHLQEQQQQAQWQAAAQDKAVGEEMARLHAETKALRASLAETQALKDKLQDDFETYRESRCRTVEELESVRGQVEHLQKEREASRQDAEKAGKGMSDLQELVKKMEQEVNSLRHENGELQDQATQASNELAKVKQQVTEQQQQQQQQQQDEAEKKEEHEQASDSSSAGGDVVTIPRSEYQKLRSAADGAEVMRVMAEEASTNTEQLRAALESLRSESTAVRQETTALQAKVRDRDDTIGRLIEQKEMLEQLVHSREQESVGPRSGTLCLVVEGEVEDGDVILIERRQDGAWVRQNDASVVVMDEYVTSLNLNSPDTPSPLPVQVLMIHDFGHTKGIEITRYLREV